MAKKMKTKAVKPIAKPNNGGTCPDGEVWDPILKKCVGNVGG